MNWRDMKIVTLASAKIRRPFYELIRAGVKRYEVRTAPLSNVDAFVFRDDHSGEVLDILRIEEAFPVERDDDQLALRLSGIGAGDFRELFPRPEDGGPERLWVAKLGERVSFDELMRGSDEHFEAR